MERYNPFASPGVGDDPAPLTTNFNRTSSMKGTRSLGRSGSGALASQQQQQRLSGSRTDSQVELNPSSSMASVSPRSPTTEATRYSTSFPDPFNGAETRPSKIAPQTTGGGPANRSNSVTFAPTSRSIDDPISSSSPTRSSRSQTRASATGGAGGSGTGFTSFLSRTTSVTSSSVTDRVSGAVESVRSAVDSLSSQIQQAVPSNLNERLNSQASNLISAGADPASPAQAQQQTSGQLFTASYLASKLSSATGQFSSSSPGSGSLPVISRQRVILILDSFDSTDWAQQFANYRKLTSLGSTQPSAPSALTSFFTSATDKLTSSVIGVSTATGGPTAPGGSLGSPSSGIEGGADLIEQADFRDISVLANQTSSTATIFVSSGSQNGLFGSNGGSQSTRTAANCKIVRPEYVIVRQRTKERVEHLRGIVTALNYCLVPMFEPMEIWNVFQDRQLIFAKLLRVQKTLGKENFPLIPQIYFQTHQDLLNYINSSSVILPCLARTGPLGKGKIRIDNLQMLRDFASIVATSNSSCTIEQYLDVKCDLIVQKLGTSLKLFKKAVQYPRGQSNQQEQRQQQADERPLFGGIFNDSFLQQDQQQYQFGARQAASKQTSIGSSVLSSLISSTSNQQQQRQQFARRTSNQAATSFERVTEVSIRYRSWVEAIAREFEKKIEAFCIKIAVSTNDREYIVGLTDCSMNFIGPLDNQEEDRRSFVELIISNMNTNLPKTSLSRESSLNTAIPVSGSGATRRSSSEERSSGSNFMEQQTSAPMFPNHSSYQQPLGDKKKFASQTQMLTSNGGSLMNTNSLGATNPVGSGHQPRNGSSARAFSQLNSRSQSVSVNQSDYLSQEQSIIKPYFVRRGSDRSDSITSELVDSQASRCFDTSLDTEGSSSSLHQRQASLGQSLFDQTSTAFSSFQKQSLSFFKRLDSRGADIISSTPPLSAKSDKAFDRSFPSAGSGTARISSASPIGESSTSKISRNEFKSQSVDNSSALNYAGGSGSSAARGLGAKPARPMRRDVPPKPPPPLLGNRQSSLASYSSVQQRGSLQELNNATTPNSTPNQSRQNSFGVSSPLVSNTGDLTSTGAYNQRAKQVVRQNSALSAFEPFDLDIATKLRSERESDNLATSTAAGSSEGAVGSVAARQATSGRSLEGARGVTNFDLASLTSGDSNSTNETTTTEDTMNNLKKTFASIFGDKNACE